MGSRTGLRLVIGAVAMALVATPALLSVAPPAAAKTTATRTRAGEAKRVDSVPAPKLSWYACYGYAQCATAQLPLDYDLPRGATVEVALVRVRARDQKHRIGSLFVNPGGPGGSGTQLARFAPYAFSPAILDRFDIVGFDPRGTNYSQPVACFDSGAQQTPVLADLTFRPFPITATEEQRYVRGSQALGRACSGAARPLAAAMSTAEVARDMEVLRRSVGDKQLNYLGFSYGSYLGQVYANLFPNRFRSMVIDGVLDPVAWAGTSASASRPQTDRILSADGAARALRELLVLCDRAGGARCSFASGDPVANFDLIAQRLKKVPLVAEDPDTGEEQKLGYAELISMVMDSLYYPDGYAEIEEYLTALMILTEPPAKRAATLRPAVRQAAMTRLTAAQRRAGLRHQQPLGSVRRFGFPYDNTEEAYASITCTDSLNPRSASSWSAAAAAADRRAKYFGRLWAWASAPCASGTWTAKDEDAYRGPFNRRTLAPVLVVGSTRDPATNYSGAVRAAALLPNSRLLTSTNWGHTAYGTSECATNAIDNYLLKGTLPAKGKRCNGDIEPFEDDPEAERTAVRSLSRRVAPLAPLPGR
ncbi:MAG TPA: alpha/beta hydrolase [Propionibacteriaceae bacterium]